MAVREISCQEIVELVTDYLEDALPRDERKAFEAHLRAVPTARTTSTRCARRCG